MRVDPEQLRRDLLDRHRQVSGPALAALVTLAVDGDDQAASLVALSLLPRMVATARRHGDHGNYDELVGILWEAIVTAANPRCAALRESIERTVWRRKWRQERPLASETEPRVDHDVADEAIAGHHLDQVLARFEAAGTISPAGRRILERLAAGHARTDDAATDSAARKLQWRTVTRLRAHPDAVQALSA